MKYEMIFCDQSLFDGAPDDAEYAGWFCQEIRWYMILNGKILFSDGGTWCTSDNPYLSADIAAMRRIIKEPKRWTWEDKKAGVLPEVGAKCSHCHSVDERTVLLVTDKYVGIERDNSDMNPYFVTHAEFLHYYIPIETPEEKAKRLRDEWVESVMNLTPCAEPSMFLTTAQENQTRRIYDALLSGELPVPVKGE